MLTTNIIQSFALALSLLPSIDAAAIEARNTVECTYTPINPKVKPRYLQCGSTGTLKKPHVILKFSSGGVWQNCREACTLDNRCISYSHNHATEVCALYSQTILSSSPVFASHADFTFWNHRCFTKTCHAVTTTKKTTTTKKATTTKKVSTSVSAGGNAIKPLSHTSTITSTKSKTASTLITSSKTATSTSKVSSSSTTSSVASAPTVLDGSFEVSPLEGIAANWTSGADVGATQMTGDAQSGSAFLRLKAPSAAPVSSTGQNISTFVPGQNYTFSGYYRLHALTPSLDGSAKSPAGSFQVFAGAAGQLFQDDFASDDMPFDWTFFNKTFTAPTATIDFGLDLINNALDNIAVDLDNFKISKLTSSSSSTTSSGLPVTPKLPVPTSTGVSMTVGIPMSMTLPTGTSTSGSSDASSGMSTVTSSASTGFSTTTSPVVNSLPTTSVLSGTITVPTGTSSGTGLPGVVTLPTITLPTDGGLSGTVTLPTITIPTDTGLSGTVTLPKITLPTDIGLSGTVTLPTITVPTDIGLPGTLTLPTITIPTDTGLPGTVTLPTITVPTDTLLPGTVTLPTVTIPTDTGLPGTLTLPTVVLPTGTDPVTPGTPINVLSTGTTSFGAGQPTTVVPLPTADDLSFETAGTDGGAADWTPVAGSGSVTRVLGTTAAPAQDGKAYLEIKSSTLGSFAYQPFYNFVPGRSYTISVYYRPVKVAGLTGTCAAQISTEGLGVPTTALVTGASNTWTQLSETFAPITTALTINVGIPLTLATCTIDFDNIMITDNGPVLTAGVSAGVSV